MDIFGQLKKHWFVGIIMTASICIGTTWIVANSILVQPRNFTIEQLEKTVERLENENNNLGNKIAFFKERISNDAIINDPNSNEQILKAWKGIWLTTYRNGFSHKLEFIINENKLIGSYDFDNVKGEIIVNEISKNIITAVWIQEIDNKVSDSGDLKFTLRNNSSFIGTYTKKSENYKTSHSWDGNKIS